MLLSIHMYFNTQKQRTLQHTSVDHMEKYVLQHHALAYIVQCYKKHCNTIRTLYICQPNKNIIFVWQVLEVTPLFRKKNIFIHDSWSRVEVFATVQLVCWLVNRIRHCGILTVRVHNLVSTRSHLVVWTIYQFQLQHPNTLVTLIVLSHGHTVTLSHFESRVTQIHPLIGFIFRLLDQLPHVESNMIHRLWWLGVDWHNIASNDKTILGN